MKTVLLPVKDFKDAKQRLAAALQPRERAGLARAMFSDVLGALAGSRFPERITIFTASGEAAQMARPFGFDIVEEEPVGGHSQAVNYMLEELSANGASRIFVLAADLPKLTAYEIDFVLSAVSEPITIIPSRDGTGTNGLVFEPPARITVEYGDGSFRRHLSKAAAAGLRAEVLNVPGIAFDVDTPEDLDLFRSDPVEGSATWEYLKGLHR